MNPNITHQCTSGCNNSVDCPMCEHGYDCDNDEVCPICDEVAGEDDHLSNVPEIFAPYFNREQLLAD